jgi:hypothetical protein
MDVDAQPMRAIRIAPDQGVAADQGSWRIGARSLDRISGIVTNIKRLAQAFDLL